MFFLPSQAARPRPNSGIAVSSRFPSSFFSRPLQRRLQVHRQQARPHPYFRGLFPFIPDTSPSKMLFAVSDPAFDPVSFFLFSAEPRILPAWLRLPSQRFERRPHAHGLQSRAVLSRPVFRVAHEVQRKLPEPLHIGLDMPGHILRFIERFVLPVVQEQEAVHMRQRASRPELRFPPLLSRLDRPHVRPIKTHDPAGDPIHFLFMSGEGLARYLGLRPARFQSLPIGTAREVFPQAARPADFGERVMSLDDVGCRFHE